MVDLKIRDFIEKYRGVLDKLAGVNRKVVSVCSDCQHEIDEWDIEDGRTHVCPPKP